jgi:TATA-binding protein-associated factor
MVKQDFAIPATTSKKNDMDVDRNHVWEVRHAGLLGIKYLVAVRSDLFEEVIVKQEGSDLECGKEVLRGVADAAILGYGVDVGSLIVDLIYSLQVR